MYILTWKVDKQITVACPDFKPDPYTGEFPTFRCLVNHFENVTENKMMDFLTESEAKEFASKAPASCYDFKLNGETIINPILNQK